MAAFSHILWDNDGVLVDTEGLYFEACRRALEPLGVELSQPLFGEYSMTRGVSVFEIALERGLLTREALPEHLAWRDDLYADLLASQDVVVPSAEELLARLSADYRMGVVTSAKRRHFVLTHARTRLGEHLSFDYAREDYARSKPHPDPYLTALQGQGLDPEQCVVVEDTPRGLAAALAAGLRCVVIPNPLAGPARFDGALAVLSRLEELPDVLEGA